MSESNGSNCPVCAFKHLASAKVAVEEFLLGWNEPVHAAKIIGNLSHCEQHLLAVGGETPIALANDIRNWRRTFETMSGDWMEDPRPLLPEQIGGIAREMIAKLDEFIRRCDDVITGVEDDAPRTDEPLDELGKLAKAFDDPKFTESVRREMEEKWATLTEDKNG